MLAQLEQPDDGVHPVGELVGLGAQRVGGAAGVVQLAGQPDELGAVPQGDHPAAVLASYGDRRAVEDQHPLAVQHDPVVARVGAAEHVAHPLGDRHLGEVLAHVSPSSSRAESLTSVTRPARSSASTPSFTPCKTPSRCSSSAAISRGSRPNVCRRTRAVISAAAASPESSTASAVHMSGGSAPAS